VVQRPLNRRHKKTLNLAIQGFRYFGARDGIEHFSVGRVDCGLNDFDYFIYSQIYSLSAMLHRFLVNP
jgi:hypothetical protein